MPAQLIIFMDSVGTIRAEAPGINGQRAKLDLSSDFALRNPELIAELKSQLARTKPAAQAPQAVCEDPQILREKRIADAREAHQLEWTEKFNNATSETREIMLYRKEQAELKSQARQHARAKQVYEQVATDHGINLANRVISNPRRRPNKKIPLTNGSTYNPKTNKSFGRVIDITLQDYKAVCSP